MSPRELNRLSNRVIGHAIQVHDILGPGMLESVYHRCLEFELVEAGYRVASRKRVAIDYKGHRIDNAFEVDLLVEDALIIEVKHVAAILPVHEAQTLTYLKFTGCHLGLIINFDVPRLRDGIRRLVMNLPE